MKRFFTIKNNTTNDVLMNKNKLLYLICLLCAFPLWISAQDVLPEPLHPRTVARQIKETNPLTHLRLLQKVVVNDSLPPSFKHTQENRILHEEYLFPFFEKLCNNNAPVRIVHLGDSHVRGHVFSVTTRRELEQVFGDRAVCPDSIAYRTSAIARETGEAGLVYHTLGINGATTVQFTSEERLQEIADLKPDLIILSFGTNESHNKRYHSAEHRQQMDALLTLLYQRCPNTLIMLTTPPGSYVRLNRRRRVINPRTPLVVETLLQFAKERNLPIWDLYDIAGGKSNACSNWKNGHYMQRDQVHYTQEGYRIQGALLAEALIKAFNHYVAN